MLGLKLFTNPSRVARLGRDTLATGSRAFLTTSIRPVRSSVQTKQAPKSLDNLNFSVEASSRREVFKSLTSSCLKSASIRSAFGIRNIRSQTTRAASDVAHYSEEGQTSGEAAERCPPVVGYWMLAMGAMVFGIVVVGGLTRLTESGLSIVEWNLIKGIKPPTTEEEWEKEFEKYKQFPEFKKLNSLMTLEEFKSIFFLEWLHRLWGRAIGVAFVIPAIYFFSRGRLTPKIAKRSLGFGGLIGFQGALGWYMVKSGLDQKLLEDPSAVPRVSQYRLASHLGTAFLLYVGFMMSGFEILSDNKLKRVPQKGFLAPITNPKFRAFRGHAIGTTALVFLTALSGAFVAGLDAGLVYNTFPNMGEGIVPPTEELWSPLYSSDKKLLKDSNEAPTGMWRNLFDNPTTVQFNHRVLAMTTLSSIIALYFLSTRLRLPRNTRIGTNVMTGAGLAQVSLGISTLIYLVPVPLAAAHQAGSLALLTSGLYLVHSLRRPLLLTAPEEPAQEEEGK